ncbi:hypothetical protein PsYK624_062990 [Phanerochaete sordida]|uniref:Uncharacterized protein n=1 Tax=Phanerochaete sordida TaxID=48140 RepID=A0A9P3G8C6_9APHY|nr:hypothetical protein PsYK624_062990 [Phanerochaete sordida]
MKEAVVYGAVAVYLYTVHRVQVYINPPLSFLSPNPVSLAISVRDSTPMSTPAPEEDGGKEPKDDGVHDSANSAKQHTMSSIGSLAPIYPPLLEEQLEESSYCSASLYSSSEVYRSGSSATNSTTGQNRAVHSARWASEVQSMTLSHQHASSGHHPSGPSAIRDPRAIGPDSNADRSSEPAIGISSNPYNSGLNGRPFANLAVSGEPQGYPGAPIGAAPGESSSIAKRRHEDDTEELLARADEPAAGERSTKRPRPTVTATSTHARLHEELQVAASPPTSHSKTKKRSLLSRFRTAVPGGRKGGKDSGDAAGK